MAKWLRFVVCEPHFSPVIWENIAGGFLSDNEISDRVHHNFLSIKGFFFFFVFFVSSSKARCSATIRRLRALRLRITITSMRLQISSKVALSIVAGSKLKSSLSFIFCKAGFEEVSDGEDPFVAVEFVGKEFFVFESEGMDEFLFCDSRPSFRTEPCHLRISLQGGREVPDKDRRGRRQFR